MRSHPAATGWQRIMGSLYGTASGGRLARNRIRHAIRNPLKPACGHDYPAVSRTTPYYEAASGRAVTIIWLEILGMLPNRLGVRFSARPRHLELEALGHPIGTERAVYLEPLQRSNRPLSPG
jgi:hypothetical protein